MARPRQPLPPPTRAEVVRFLEGPGAGLHRNEVLKALARERGDRAVLKEILRGLDAEGLTGRRRKLKERPAERRAEVPTTTVLDVTGIDHNGDLLLTYPEQPELRILLPVEHLEGLAPGVGDRVLARLLPGAEGGFEARPLRVLPRQPREVTGIVEQGRDGLVIRSADRKARAEFLVARDDLGGAERGRSGRWPRSCRAGGWGRRGSR